MRGMGECAYELGLGLEFGAGIWGFGSIAVV